MVTCATCGEDVKGKVHPPNCKGAARPLHVRVAEALGWVGLKHDCAFPDGAQRWTGFTSEEFREKRKGRPIQVPEYPSDREKATWLIEKFGITIRFDDNGASDRWVAYTGFDVVDGEVVYECCDCGGSVPEAVARVIVVAAEAGKLKEISR